MKILRKVKLALQQEGTGQFYTIGEIARKVGLTNQMIHLYCNMGLIQEVTRSGSGYRLFDEGAIRRIRIIRRLNRVGGYSLREIRQTFRRGFEVDAQ